MWKDCDTSVLSGKNATVAPPSRVHVAVGSDTCVLKEPRHAGTTQQCGGRPVNASPHSRGGGNSPRDLTRIEGEKGERNNPKIGLRESQ
jgi:hypothetical protein